MKCLLSCLVFASSLYVATYADASTITSAVVYMNTPNPTDASSSLNSASSLAHANFTIGGSGISYNSNNSTTETVAHFLNNPTFSGAVNSFNSSAFIGSSMVSGIEIVITGTLDLLAGNNSFILGHDDGAVLMVGGVNVFSQPGPTSFSTSPFTVNESSTGNYSFTLQYSECCTLPANLDFSVNGVNVGSTPEPSSLILLGTGLAAVAGFVRRRSVRAA